MNAPKFIAIVLLTVEVAHALALGRDNIREKRGKDLLFDAVLWTAILYWGGFWN